MTALPSLPSKFPRLTVNIPTAAQPLTLRKLDIRAMSDADRKKLRGTRTGCELHGLFVSDDLTEEFPVRFFAKHDGTYGVYQAYAVRNDGTYEDRSYVTLPAEPLDVGPGPHFNRLVYNDKVVAIIEIVNTVAAVNKDEGLNGAPPKFKLVRI